MCVWIAFAYFGSFFEKLMSRCLILDDLLSGLLIEPTSEGNLPMTAAASHHQQRFDNRCSSRLRSFSLSLQRLLVLGLLFEIPTYGSAASRRSRLSAAHPSEVMPATAPTVR